MIGSRGRAVLVLADGSAFWGVPFGGTGQREGEVVFTTTMTGYQEAITDPSYHQQILTMTAPEIGNVGINALDDEAAAPAVAGFVIRASSPSASNYRSEQTLEAWLRKHDVVGISEVDTRALTLHIREAGAQMGIVASPADDVEKLVRRARSLPTMSGRDLANEVTCAEPYRWESGTDFAELPSIDPAVRAAATTSGGAGDAKRWKVVAYDFGVKQSILRLLVDHGCDVEVVPAGTPADEVLARDPDGVFLSNGPGDPAACTYAIDAVKGLLGKRPLFGICLGHQILALAMGARTYKLKFGHRGANHPVRDEVSRRVLVTTQNHGFAVDPGSLPDDVVVTHVSLNDDCVEGLRHTSLPAFSVQYHPEGSAGPHDARGHFDEFVELMRRGRA